MKPGSVARTGPTRRLPELDALRGVAALTVVTHHAFLIIPEQLRLGYLSWRDASNLARPWIWLHYSPFQVLTSGRPAVVLFFVLSGMVLALPFTSGAPVRYPGFLCRRLLRIWPPLAVAILIATILQSAVSGIVVPDASTWLHGQWVGPVGIEVVLRHLTMLGSEGGMDLDPVMWSLVHELRMSIVFPVLIFAARAVGPVALVAAGLVISAAVGFDHPNPYGGTLALTVHFVFPFTLGVLIAWQLDAIRARRFGGWPRPVRLAVPFLIVAGLMVPGRVIVGDFAIAIASALLIVLCLTSARLSRLLTYPVLLRLGRISYSLYLVHFIVLMVAVRLIGASPLALVLPLLLVLSWLAAELFFAAVERPSHHLARILGARLDRAS